MQTRPLQYPATPCKTTLQYPAIPCKRPCNTLQTTLQTTLQYPAIPCNTLQYPAKRPRNTLQARPQQYPAIPCTRPCNFLDAFTLADVAEVQREKKRLLEIQILISAPRVLPSIFNGIWWGGKGPAATLPPPGGKICPPGLRKTGVKSCAKSEMKTGVKNW